HRNGDALAQSISHPSERFAHARKIVRQHEQTNHEAAFEQSVGTEDEFIAHLTIHLCDCASCVIRVVPDFGVFVASFILGIFQIREINVNDAVEQAQDLN